MTLTYDRKLGIGHWALGKLLKPRFQPLAGNAAPGGRAASKCTSLGATTSHGGGASTTGIPSLRLGTRQSLKAGTSTARRK